MVLVMPAQAGVYPHQGVLCNPQEDLCPPSEGELLLQDQAVVDLVLQ